MKLNNCGDLKLQLFSLKILNVKSDALQVGFLSSLTIVNKGSSLTIINKGLSLKIVNKGS